MSKGVSTGDGGAGRGRAHQGAKRSSPRAPAGSSVMRQLAQAAARRGVGLHDLATPEAAPSLPMGTGPTMAADVFRLHKRPLLSEARAAGAARDDARPPPFVAYSPAQSLVLLSLDDMERLGLCADDSVGVRVTHDASAEVDETSGIVGVGHAWPSRKRAAGEAQLGRALHEAILAECSDEVAPRTPIFVRLQRLDAQEAAVAREAVLRPMGAGSAEPLAGGADERGRRALLSSALLGRSLLDGSLVFISTGGVERRYQVFCKDPVCRGPFITTSRSRVVVAPGGPSVDGRPTSDGVGDDLGAMASPGAGAAAGDSPRKLTPASGDDPFEAVGGLDEVLHNVRQLLDIPLREPWLFARYGLPTSKGLLLYGPPGTGKTLIARSVARSAAARLFVVNGAEVLSKFVGDTEERLREIFSRAVASAPAVIFLDEVDALCADREEARSAGRSGELEQRVVATVTSLIDEIQAHDRVVVIAATNRPHSVDAALRRPGRLDREIEVGIPSEPAREQILRVVLREYPSRLADEDIMHFARVTNGFVGADLAALVKEAALAALHRLSDVRRGALNEGAEVESAELGGAEVVVTAEDVRAALKVCGPSALREVRVDVPRVLWSDIGGQDDVKQALKEAVEWPLLHPEAFERMGIRPPKGVLLYGPPGCSKTMMAKALATEGGMNFIAVKGPELFSKWVGESERAVAEVFRKARAAAPTVVFFDEIDALAGSRGGDDGGSGGVGARVLSQLLHEMDGVKPLLQVVVVAATNRPDLLDRALLRPGRFDRLLYVGPPDKTSREAIVRLCLQQTPHSDAEMDVSSLGESMAGLSGAEIVSVFREAALCAMEEDIETTCIQRRHVERARARVTPQITPAMLAFYERFDTVGK